MSRKTTLRKILKSRPFWIVASLIVSLMLWVYVTDIEGDTQTETFRDVKLIFQGEDQLRDTKDIILTGVDTSSVSVTLTGSRRAISQLNSSEITAVVDISKITYTGKMQFTYDLIYDDDVDSTGITIENRQPETISFTLDKQVTRNIDVKGVFNGSVAENFTQENLEFNPSTVKVSGPAEEINKIQDAWVVIEKENVDKTFTVDAPYILRDKDGNELEFDDDVTLETGTVSVTLPIKATKEVQLTVDLISGGGASAEKNAVITCVPETVTISGDSDVLAGINKISLATIDLADVNPSMTETYTLFIPNDTENISGVTEVTVTVQIKGVSTSKKTLNNIECKNNTEGYIATIMTPSMDITVRAEDSVLRQIGSNNLRGVVDLTELGNAVGIFAVPVEVHVDGFPTAGVIGEYKVYVSIALENQ